MARLLTRSGEFTQINPQSYLLIQLRTRLPVLPRLPALLAVQSLPEH